MEIKALLQKIDRIEERHRWKVKCLKMQIDFLEKLLLTAKNK
jgi:hypothetical protein